MRRVLIVTSSYAPTMIADMQRTRQLAWELPDLGWEVEILSPSVDYQPPTCVDPDSSGFFAPHSSVHYVAEVGRNLFKMAGIGTIGWRAFLPLWRTGKRLLSQKRFDLIYISTAHFPLFMLGRLWQSKFGVPYVLDLHDPLYRETSPNPIWAAPRFKHRISNALAKHLESAVATGAQGLIAVSPVYIDTLRRRHQSRQPAWLRPGRSDAIPFSALSRDLSEAAIGSSRSAKREGPPYRIVYVGVGGPVMAKSFKLFSRALSGLRERRRELCDGIRVELFGTTLGWRRGESRFLQDIAENSGVGDLVVEEPNRVSYRHSLELLLASDGALVLGVEDAGYMPSKLFSYALSGKPLLAVLNRHSPAFCKFQDLSDLGHVLWIENGGEMAIEDATRELETFLVEVVARRTFDREGTLAPYMAPAMAQRHVALFDACVS